jgi:site-specific DNA-methyltransferase (adenine-specific)
MRYPINTITTGDATKLAEDIPDGSIDLIFTDPPYLGEYLPVYYSIVEHAARVLKPSGFLLMYVGGYWKDEIMAEARKHLKYFWDYIVWEPGNSPVNWPRKTIARNKSILAYTRQDAENALPQTQVLSVWQGGGEDKRFHIWGQDESQARYFITCFSKPGDVVLDFCVGGGTTPYIAEKFGRNYLGFEIDPEVAEGARARVRSLTQPAPDAGGSAPSQADFYTPAESTSQTLSTPTPRR